MRDLLPYLHGNGQIYDLAYKIKGNHGIQTLQTQDDRHPGVFYQVKDSQWERLYSDRHYIYRHADTSEAADRYYIQTTDGTPGSVWCPRFMTEGQQYERDPLVIHYNKADGSIRTQGHFRSTIQFLHHKQFHTYRTQGQCPEGITLQDIVILVWLVDGRIVERYHYARDYGLVAWHGDRAGSSQICAHRDKAPDLQREHIESLSPFRPGTLFYNPSPNYTPTVTTPGVDVSKWQGANIDWGLAADSGVKFAFIRSSYGTSRDPRFIANLQGATEAGLHTGAYHYLHVRSPIKQAAHFYDVTTEARGLCPAASQIPLLNALDVEGKGKTAAVVKQFLDEYERLAGRKPIIYTAAHIWNNLPGDTSWARNYDLWVANYTPQDRPYLPRDWKEWRFWQHSSTYKVPGFPRPIDHNRFNGSYEQFLAYLQTYWTQQQEAHP